nr:MAG TPA: hypothetical protein [Caudoviricetes sp.]
MPPRYFINRIKMSAHFISFSSGINYISLTRYGIFGI